MKTVAMGSESIAHPGYYSDNTNSALSSYLSQMSNSSVNSSASTNSSNNSPPAQWPLAGAQPPSNQQQPQQQQQQQQSRQQHLQQIHHQIQHHPLQQQRHTTSASSASSSSSASSNQQEIAPQNLQLPPPNHNLHMFSANYQQQRTNPWNIPNMSAAYQRIYSENHYQNYQPHHHQHHNHHNNHIAGNNQQINMNCSNENNIGHHQQQNNNHKRCGNHSGKSGNSKDICGDDKFKEDGDPWNVEAQAAFLGPNLWDKTLPYDADLKYADLDEFLSENNIPDGLPGTHLGHSAGLGHRSDALGHSAGLSLSLGHVTTKRERSPSPSDCVSPDTINPPSPAESTFSFASSGRDFDPRTRAFSDEELKPQPMIKKSRKQFVPDELKDDKYWARRRKNNIAAKRSRDARRQKENQIAMRARYLEKENSTLHQEVEQLKQENMELRARLSKYQEV